MYLLVAPALLGFMITERRLPDWKEVIREMFRYRMGGIPYVRDIVSGITSDYGYPLSPVQDAGDKVLGLFYQGEKLMHGDTELDRLAKGLVYVSGYASGLHSGVATIALDGAMDLAEGRTSNPMRLILRELRKR